MLVQQPDGPPGALGWLNVEEFLKAARIPLQAHWCVAFSVGGIRDGRLQIAVVKGPLPQHMAVVNVEGEWQPYDGMGFVLAGLVVPEVPDGVPWPSWGISGELNVQLWLEQARKQGCPLWAERGWHPDIAIEPAIRGWDRKYTEADVTTAKKCLRLLEVLRERRGRPAGSGKGPGSQKGIDIELVRRAQAMGLSIGGMAQKLMTSEDTINRVIAADKKHQAARKT